MDRPSFLAVVEALWSKPLFERRLTAVELLTSRAGILEPTELDLVERFLRESRTWALVDGLAAHVAGALVVRFPALNATLDRWSRDEDFWLRRSALLALLLPLRRGGGDSERYSRYADAMLDEKEFFIRKAIGWVLRELSKQRRDLVFGWLEPRVARASGATRREATKYLTPAQRQALTAHVKPFDG